MAWLRKIWKDLLRPISIHPLIGMSCVDGSRSRHLSAKVWLSLCNHEQKEPSTPSALRGRADVNHSPAEGPLMAKAEVTASFFGVLGREIIEGSG
jgi:hypothetical protein